MTPRPPKLAQWLLNRFTGNAQIEDIVGDLEEAFLHKHEKSGAFSATLFYWTNTVSLLFSYALRRRKKQSSYTSYYSHSSMGLFRNYVKVALRNMAKQKLFTGVNILGLSLGMSFNLLILGILSQVFLFDQFHERKDRIFRVITHTTSEEGPFSYATTFADVQSTLGEDFTGIENDVSFSRTTLVVMKRTNEISLTTAITSLSYFEVFSFDLAHGDKATCLQNPNSIVLSGKMAALLFPNSDPLNQVVETNQGMAYTVTGVLAEHPRQTHLSFDALISSADRVSNPWSDYTDHYVYVLLEEGSSPDHLQPALASLSATSNSFHEKQTFQFELQPLTEVSPGKNLRGDITPFDWITTILLFVLGLLILIPAAFNYSNLMIARSLKRAKEIGIRKIVGGQRREITQQFLVESIVLTLIALVGSIAIFGVVRSEFLSMIIGADTLDLSLNPGMLGLFLLFALVTGLLVGLFPATYFSRLSPLTTLKGDSNNSGKGISGIRKSLMVIQFSLSLGFVIGVVVITWQYKYLLQSEVGFRKEHTLVVPLQGQDADVLGHEFGSISEVTSMSGASALPGVEGGQEIQIPLHDLGMDSLPAYQIAGDENLIRFLGLEFLSGVHPSHEMKHAVWINETLLHELELHSSGEELTHVVLADGLPYAIAGVFRDFHFQPLSERISSLVIRIDPAGVNYLLLSVRSDDFKGLISRLDEKWTSLNEEAPFECFFLDQKIEESYQSVIFLIKMFSFLGLLSITISCIGILGMVVYLTENRTKELAIRKTMGASLIDLYYVLGGSFMKLLLIATVITTPLAYLMYDRIFVRLINQYSTGVGLTELVIGVGIMLVLASLPLFWMVGKISRVNPAENLRYE